MFQTVVKLLFSIFDDLMLSPMKNTCRLLSNHLETQLTVLWHSELSLPNVYDVFFGAHIEYWWMLTKRHNPCVFQVLFISFFASLYFKNLPFRLSHEVSFLIYLRRIGLQAEKNEFGWTSSVMWLRYLQQCFGCLIPTSLATSSAWYLDFPLW